MQQERRRPHKDDPALQELTGYQEGLPKLNATLKKGLGDGEELASSRLWTAGSGLQALVGALGIETQVRNGPVRGHTASMRQPLG